MQPEESLRIIKSLADGVDPDTGEPLPKDDPEPSSITEEPETPRGADRAVIAPPELREALRIVLSVAHGKDPFTDDPLSKYRPEQNPETVKALCLALASLLNRAPAKTTPAETTPDEQISARPSFNRQLPLEEYLKQVEKEAILQALKDTRYNKAEAARLLGITYRALRYKLESYFIEV